ncbi:uncharacterized protein LOC106154262 [Lingula anatina]|uniref:Uncharacterized protein LOC106154262 n=1 Tax=Lingula anatina TaxID=7574 RepID=A0A1S3HDC0_LINAN|nr:uncharacterized protein LOC106154262 [Lingula anatina]|eukprot:XP_013384015.1 uncharacterized protein LOC106154262 [Lingula anatina]
MKRYRLDILGISECRWVGSGRLTTNDGSLILYSGHESTHSHGVAIILSREKARTLMEWEPISWSLEEPFFHTRPFISSPDDHIIINGKWQKSLKDVRVYRGADAKSDHFLVASSIRLKHRKVIPQSQQQKRKRPEIPKLKCPLTKTAFVLELKNRFSALAGEDRTEADNVSQKWDTIKSTYCTTAESVLGFKKKNKEWLTPETWKLIDERRSLKGKLLDSKSPRLVEQVRAAYKSKDKKVKKSARSDKRAFVEKLASEAEQAAAQGDMGTVYKITKQLSGSHNNYSAPVKDKNGKTLSTERKQAARWVQHFKEVLNHPDPSEPANPTPADGILDINTDPPTREEVRKLSLL